MDPLLTTYLIVLIVGGIAIKIQEDKHQKQEDTIVKCKL